MVEITQQSCQRGSICDSDGLIEKGTEGLPCCPGCHGQGGEGTSLVMGFEVDVDH